MSRKAKWNYFFEKSIQAVLSAIEIYNKPDFKYREESFSILMVNAWEMLLKAKIVLDNRNKIESLYIEDKNKLRKNGRPFNKPKYKTNRSNNYLTIDINNAILNLKLDERLRQNLMLLIEIRDNAIHFYNESKLFEKKVLEIGTASLKSYVTIAKEWFDSDLGRYNFYLMPISFFHPYELQSFSIYKEDKQHQNLLKYIAAKENDFPSDEEQNHNISLVLETKFVKSKALTGIHVKVNPNDPSAISVKFNSEEDFGNRYRWAYKEDLIPTLKDRYQDIKFDQKFRKIINDLEESDLYCGKRYLDFKNRKGSPKKFYNPDILKEFDKHYNKKT